MPSRLSFERRSPWQRWKRCPTRRSPIPSRSRSGRFGPASRGVASCCRRRFGNISVETEAVDSEDARDNVTVKVECIGMDPYSCEEAIKRLNDYLDHELSEAERVVVLKHLEICKPCLGRFTFEQTLVVSLRQKLTHLHAPETLREKLSSLLRHQER